MNGCGVFRGYPYNGLCKDGYEWYASAIRKFRRANRKGLIAGYNADEYMQCLAAAEMQEHFPGSELCHFNLTVKYNGIEYTIQALKDMTYHVIVKRPGSKKEKTMSDRCNLDFTVYKVKMDMWKNRKDHNVVYNETD